MKKLIALFTILAFVFTPVTFGAIERKTKISSNDSTAGYLNGKLVAGNGIGFTENNDGGNETLTITVTDIDVS